MRVLTTRAPGSDRALTTALGAAGIETAIWPLTRVAPLIGAPPVIATGAAVVVTSANALRVFAAAGGTLDRPVFAVGGATAEAARVLGAPRGIDGGGDGKALLATMRKAAPAELHWLRGEAIACDIGRVLRAEGVPVTESVVYRVEETGPPPPRVASLLAGGRIDAAAFYSARAVHAFRRHGLALTGDRPPVACVLSPRIGEAANGALPVRIAQRPDTAGMVELCLAIRRDLLGNPDG